MRLQMGAGLKVTITLVNMFIVYVKILLYGSYLTGSFLIACMTVRYSPLHYIATLGITVFSTTQDNGNSALINNSYIIYVY